MKQQEMRDIAIGAIRSEARQHGIDPTTLDAQAALRVLDDIYRIEPELIASYWYGNASNNQIALFRKEWTKWQRG